MTAEYRNGLIIAEQKSQDDYDKTIVSLSGGALGISLVFIKDIIGTTEPTLVWAVITAWGLWAASLASVVISYFSSRVALRKAIEQTDSNNFTGGAGGCASTITQIFNSISGVLFVLGIIFLILFAANNIGGKSMSDNNGKTIIEKGYIPPPPPPPKVEPPAPARPLTEGVIPPPPPPKPKP